MIIPKVDSKWIDPADGMAVKVLQPQGDTVLVECVGERIWIDSLPLMSFAAELIPTALFVIESSPYL